MTDHTEDSKPETTPQQAVGVDALVSHVRIEYVEWLDSGGRNGWHEPDEECAAMECVSVGWVTDESDSAVTITGHMQKKPRFHHSDITIPKCAITKRLRIAVERF